MTRRPAQRRHQFPLYVPLIPRPNHLRLLRLSLFCGPHTTSVVVSITTGILTPAATLAYSPFPQFRNLRVFRPPPTGLTSVTRLCLPAYERIWTRGPMYIVDAVPPRVYPPRHRFTRHQFTRHRFTIHWFTRHPVYRFSTSSIIGLPVIRISHHQFTRHRFTLFSNVCYSRFHRFLLSQC